MSGKNDCFSNINTREYEINGSTYEVRAVFGDKIKLEDILSHRVIQEMESKTLENQAKLACLSDE